MHRQKVAWTCHTKISMHWSRWSLGMKHLALYYFAAPEKFKKFTSDYYWTESLQFMVSVPVLHLERFAGYIPLSGIPSTRLNNAMDLVSVFVWDSPPIFKFPHLQFCLLHYWGAQGKIAPRNRVPRKPNKFLNNGTLEVLYYNYGIGSGLLFNFQTNTNGDCFTS